MICGAPGSHGVSVAGMHGIGVKTPNAAAVALATDGLAMLVHTPKDWMLIMGLKSMILPIKPPVTMAGPGVGINGDGIAPNVQVS